MDYGILSRRGAEKLMNISMRTGLILLENGAEIYRVEDTIDRILSSRKNIEDVHVVATYSYIMISFIFEGKVLTRLNKIRSGDFNLKKISEANDFSRKFTSSEMSLVVADKELGLIEESFPYSFEIKTLTGSLASGILALTLGGRINEALATFFVVFAVIYLLDRNNNNQYFMRTMYAAILTTFFVVMMDYLGIDIVIDTVIVSSIYLLFPGISLTNGMRDVMNGDMQSGLSGLIQAAFTAFALAGGVGLVILIYSRIGV